MSRHHPYRPPPSDADLRPGLRRYGDVPRQSQQPASSSSAVGAAAQVLQENAASLLSSCGLDPDDLALLAELPEDVLTVESLPHILHQLKGSRGGLKPLPSRAPPHRPTSRDWEQRQNQSVQYPPVQDPPVRPKSSIAHRSEDRCGWGSAGPSSSSSRPVADHDYRSCLPDPPRHADAGPPASRVAPLPDQQNRRQSRSGSTQPSSKQALDFHGRTPPTFPYSCSLCDITVLSERVWTQHINSTVHADGQLSLLQQCPTWDCRMETVSRRQTSVHKASLPFQRRRDGEQSERQQEGRPAPPAQRANQTSGQKQQKVKLTAVNRPVSASASGSCRSSERGGVVCVKFPARSVDEAYLRTLAEPFGKITKVLMFPSLAFVELGSADQALDLVKFHSNHPAVVNGATMDFSISNTFSFLQSSKVISFVPAPSGEDGRSDLISVVKRFGAPLYTLFLPSKAFVEMKHEADAQKMVNYYSSNKLRINDDSVAVSFSGEYKNLEQVPSAKRYEDEAGSVQRTSSTSKESNRDWETSSRSRDCYRIEKGTRTRSRSREGCRERRTGPRETRTSSGDREKSRREGRSRSRSRSRSRERSSSRSTRPDRTNKSEEPQKPDEHLGTPEVSTEKEPADEEEEEEEESEEESDIEGMGVLAEDGESLLDDEEEEDDDDPADEDEDEEVKKMGTDHQTPEEDEEVMKMGPDHQTPEEDEEVMKMGPDHQTPEEDEEVMKMGTDHQTPEEDEEVKKMRTDHQTPEEDEEVMKMGTDHQTPEEDEEVKKMRTDHQTPEEDEEVKKMGTDHQTPEEDEEVKKMRTDHQTPEEDEEVKKMGTDHQTPEEDEEVMKMGPDHQTPEEDEEVMKMGPDHQTPEEDEEVMKMGPDHQTPEEDEEVMKMGPDQGSVETSSSSGALKTARSLDQDPVSFCGSRLVDGVSRKSPRLVNRRDINQDHNEDKTGGTRGRSARLYHTRGMPGQEKAWDSSSRQSPEVPGDGPQTDFKETEGHKPATRRKTRSRRCPEDDAAKRKGTSEKKVESGETLKVEPERTEEASGPELKDVNSPGHPEPPEQGAELQSGPTGGAAAEPERILTPVGAEFVRPVVGYFCNLCQLIFCDEDEAKVQHCSSLEHHRRYQVAMETAPRTS